MRIAAGLGVSVVHCNTVYRKCCTWFVNLGNPDFFMNFSGFRVALAIASLPGMTRTVSTNLQDTKVEYLLFLVS
jgi:hypothetical protein